MTRSPWPAPAERPHGPAPSAAVLAELARAASSACLTPVHAALYLARRGRLAAEVARDLEQTADVAPDPELAQLPEHPLSFFVSCAEASGEMHAANLVAALRRRVAALDAPEPRFAGLGGARLAALGVELLGAPSDRAAMGLSGVASAVPYYTGLLRRCAERFRADAPDLVLPIDSPALHVPLARIAHRYGVPVVHFVTPQYWGWAPWRVGAYRRAVDRALTILPFEPSWFARHGVHARHVGHPIQDAWAARSADPVARGAVSVARSGGRGLVLLPGSRAGVIAQNLPWMLAVAAELRLALPGGAEIAVTIAHERPELAPLFEDHVRAAGAAGWARIATGDLRAALSGARTALAVSGTVLLELVRERLPAVVVYRLGSRREAWLSRRFLTVPWFSAVNLLAGREVYPEFAFAGEGPRAAVAAALLRCHTDEAWRAGCRAGLELAVRRLGPPGAIERAAAQALAAAVGERSDSAVDGSGTAPEARSARDALSRAAGPPPAAPRERDLEDALGRPS